VNGWFGGIGALPDRVAGVLRPLRQRLVRDRTNNAIPAHVVEADADQANVTLVLSPKGTGALTAQLADETTRGGNLRGSGAVDLQMSRSTASDRVASGTGSVIAGGTNNQASAIGTAVCGGANNIATINYAFVGGGIGNSAQGGQAAVVVGGDSNTASANQAFIGSGFLNSASGSQSVIGGGVGHVASGANSFIGGGSNNRANASLATIPGGDQASARGIIGRFAYASGVFASALPGVAQYALGVFRRETTTATPIVLTSNESAAGATNITALPDSSLYAFSAQVVCIQSAGTAGAVRDSKAWTVVGAIKRGTNAAATALLGTPAVTVLGADTNLGTDNSTGATIAVSADTTNGGLIITVTGQANKTLRWVATIETTEVVL